MSDEHVNARLISIQVGKPVTYPGLEDPAQEWRSAIVKLPVDGPVWLGTLGLDGDAQADLRSHGGPQRAVNLYPAEHYEDWRKTPGLEQMSGGAFGENFTTLGLLETTACIGDVFRVGEAVIEISQPRGPCYKLDRRWKVADLSKRAEQSRRFGWYFRVRKEGQVEAGSDLILAARPFPQWTVVRVWDATFDPSQRDAGLELVECTALSDSWRSTLLKKLG
jgi:MOSC domain-containing protein YiiM